MEAYYLTWDFGSPDEFEFCLDMQQKLERGDHVQQRWSCGKRQELPVGSLVLMVRQGTPPRGLVGLGRTTSPPYVGPHFRDESKSTNYVDVDWVTMQVAPMIEKDSLPSHIEEQITWGMRVGGVKLPSHLAEFLVGEFQRREKQSVLRNEEDTHQQPNDQLSHIADSFGWSKQRVGQGKFRDAVLSIEPCCRVTGVSDPRLLRASHIKPWSKCETKSEQLDGNNGLMLAPNVDHLFDAGFLTFANDGQVLMSNLVSIDAYVRLGVREFLNVGPFSAQQAHYLDYHRREIFSCAAK